MENLVVINIIPSGVGGIQTYGKTLEEKLTKEGIIVERVEAHKVDKTSNLTEEVSKKVVRFLANFVRLSKLIKKYKKEGKKIIIHAHVGRGISFWENAAYGLWGQILGVSFIFHIHSSLLHMEYLNSNNFVKGIRRYILNKTTQIIALSEYWKRQLLEIDILKPEKIAVVYNFVDVNKFKISNQLECRRALGLPLDKKIVFGVGRLVERKGYQYLIEAIPKIIKRYPNVRFYIGGKGPLKEQLEKMIKKLKIEKYVTLTGYIPEEELPLWFCASDIFVMPSIRETFPIVMLEALASGIPFVGSIVGTVPEIISSKDYGLLVEPANPQDLAEKILIALEKEWDREKIRRYGEQFTWENIAIKYIKLYKNVIGEDEMGNFNPDVLFISPGLLEVGSRRAAGAEVSYYLVALGLSDRYRVVFMSPYYGSYKRIIKINDKFIIHQIRMSALKKYPPKTKLDYFLVKILAIVASFLIAFEIVTKYLKNSTGTKIIVILQPKTGLIPMLLALLTRANIKILYAEGNVRPWYSPYLIRYNNWFIEKVRTIITKLTYPIYLYVAWRADLIRAQSVLIKDGMKRFGIPCEKIRIIGPPVEDRLFYLTSRKMKRNKKGINVAFIGRLTEEKNAPLLENVCKESLKIFGNELKFYIFGEGPYKRKLQKISNVAHIGSVNRDLLLEYLSSLIDLVISFQHEFGRAEIEALSLGRTLIILNSKATSRYLLNMKNGIILTKADTNSYLKALQLAKNEKLRKKIWRIAKKTAYDNFSMISVTKEWKKMINYILKVEG